MTVEGWLAEVVDVPIEDWITVGLILLVIVLVLWFIRKGGGLEE